MGPIIYYGSHRSTFYHQHTSLRVGWLFTPLQTQTSLNICVYHDYLILNMLDKILITIRLTNRKKKIHLIFNFKIVVFPITYEGFQNFGKKGEATPLYVHLSVVKEIGFVEPLIFRSLSFVAVPSHTVPTM